MIFELHQNLQTKSFITDLKLCRVLLENNRNYPWIFLVPRIPNVSKIMDLSMDHQLMLLKELDLAQTVLWNLFSPAQINVAAIGNKTPQLHVHIIARSLNDPSWPETVWDHPNKATYEAPDLELLISKLQAAFGAVTL